MLTINRRETFWLFVGDILIFILALYFSLFLRYSETIDTNLFLAHLVPFSYVFVVWALTFYIAGLYEKHTVVFTNRLPGIILRTLIVSSLLAVLFFYLFPGFGIAPKTILFFDIAITFILISLWRLYGRKAFFKSNKEKAVLVGSGTEMVELYEEINNNLRYGLEFISSINLEKVDKIDFQSEILERVYAEDVSVVAVDLRSDKVEPILPHLYNLIFSKIRFIDLHKIYEDIFDRVPLSLLKYNWFIENISLTPRVGYVVVKRLIDIVLSLLLLIIFLVLLPFIVLLIKLTDGGKIFIFQERVGLNNKTIKIVKFRTMSFDDRGLEGEVKRENRVTAIGAFLRKTRLDELPQVWNVLIGDLSLIGPRPELPVIARQYEAEIPYYNIRHLIKPGLSGWAQIYQINPPKRDANFDETKVKLSYDLYYLKNRSILLDLKIALRTIKILLSRSGK